MAEMKIDYAELGKKALLHLEDTAQRADLVQKCLLEKIISENCFTEYGKRYHFSAIKSISGYQEKVPITLYDDYEAYISRIVSGEGGVLVSAPSDFFCISSGTTGEPKYLPLTEKEHQLYYFYACGVVFGTVREYYRDLPEEKVFGKIFQLGEFAKTYMEDGRMKGIRSGAVYQWLDRDGGFDVSDYCAPKEVLFPDNLEDLLYVKVRFALAERGLRAIHGVFVNRVVGVMEYIYRNWDMLLDDMEKGEVDEKAGVSQKWRTYLKEKLLPNPSRAAELRCLPYKNLRFQMIPKIWPELKYIQAIGGKAYPYYSRQLEKYKGDIPIHHFVYGASEGIFGIAAKMDKPDSYILFPEAGFFEFLPLEGGDSTRPLCLWELKQGGRYEVLFTNHSGLYRYRMRDVIKVVGWYYKTPVVRFCYRENMVMNLAGEKSNLEQLEEAVNRFARKYRVQVKGYCVQEAFSDGMPQYLFYMECAGKMAGNTERILEEYLCRLNYEYKCCRKMNEIGRLRIQFLRQGSFERYEKYLAGKGVMMGQSKLLRLLDTEEKRQFFAAEVL